MRALAGPKRTNVRAVGIASAKNGLHVPPEQLKWFHLPLVLAVRESAGAGGDGGGGAGVVQGPGPVLTRVHVKPIFWGAEWYRGFFPTAGDICWAVETIFLGPFMDGLAQYGVGNGWLDPNPIFTSLTIDPPNPFSETQLRNLLTDMVPLAMLPSRRGREKLIASYFSALIRMAEPTNSSPRPCTS